MTIEVDAYIQKMSEEKKKVFKFQRNPWNVFLGDCPVVTTYLADKPVTSLTWAPVHVLNIFLRAVGQVWRVFIRILQEREREKEREMIQICFSRPS